MTEINPLRFCLTGDTEEIVDRLLGEFTLSCIGKNDMSLVAGFLASAAIVIAAHCQQTGQDFAKVSEMSRDQFDLALKVAGEHAKSR
jgi:hypothetical protein